MKTVLVFQGGGSLGAFGAGAWQVLAERPECRGRALVAVAGASMGALNAAAVAHHHADDDGGAAALVALWRDRIATPSLPFFGPLPLPMVPSAASVADWNGFATGLLFGNRALSLADWPVWQPWSGLGRLGQPLHDRRGMWKLLEEQFAAHASAGTPAPMLAVAAVDVMAGELRLFDSDTAPLTAQHLAASSAIPLLYDPVEIDGHLFWDGEVTRDSLLPLLLERLLASGRVAAGEPLELITVEQFPRPLAAPPRSGAEIMYRALNLMQLGKLDPPAMDGIRFERVRRIVRDPLPEDGVSGQLDHSPERVGRLIGQGRKAALRVLFQAGEGAPTDRTGRPPPEPGVTPA